MEISKLLKSVAHPKRIRIMALISRNNGRFSELMNHTNLSKTALANHLNHLVKMSLVERIARGKYALTKDGDELLKAVTTVYHNSLLREERQKEALRHRPVHRLQENRVRQDGGL